MRPSCDARQDATVIARPGPPGYAHAAAEGWRRHPTKGTDVTDEVLATEQDIRACFRLLLGREPGAAEWPGHSQRAGAPLASVVREFVNSLEFHRRGLLSVDSAMEEISVDGRPMFVYGDDLGISAALRGGVYEPEVTAAIASRLSPGDVFLDIGANLGYYTFLAADAVGPSGAVIAVEASLRNVRALRAGVRRGARSNVEIINVAASSRWTLLAFGLSGTNGITGQLRADDLQDEIVQGVPLDAALGGLERLDMIKIDVEGAEHLALGGLHGVIERHHPTIVSEFSPPGLEAVSGSGGLEYLEMLRGWGYSFAVVGEGEGSTDDPHQILERFQASGIDHIDILCQQRSV